MPAHWLDPLKSASARREYMKQYYERRREEILAHKRAKHGERSEMTIEERRVYDRQYYEKNKAKILARKRARDAIKRELKKDE